MELTFDAREFLRDSVTVMRNPVLFYKKIEKEKEWKPAFVFSIAIAIVSSIFGILQLTLLYPVFKNVFGDLIADVGQPQILDILPAFFMSTIVVILLGFVWSLILHGWLKVWKLNGTFWDAYKAFAYSRVPLSFFGWIPVVGGLFGIYSIYILAVGISIHYKTTRLKAVLLLVPLLFVLFLIQAFLFGLLTASPT